MRRRTVLVGLGLLGGGVGYKQRHRLGRFGKLDTLRSTRAITVPRPAAGVVVTIDHLRTAYEPVRQLADELEPRLSDLQTREYARETLKSARTIDPSTFSDRTHHERLELLERFRDNRSALVEYIMRAKEFGGDSQYDAVKRDLDAFERELDDLTIDYRADNLSAAIPQYGTAGYSFRSARRNLERARRSLENVEEARARSTLESGFTGSSHVASTIAEARARLLDARRFADVLDGPDVSADLRAAYRTFQERIKSTLASEHADDRGSHADDLVPSFEIADGSEVYEKGYLALAVWQALEYDAVVRSLDAFDELPSLERPYDSTTVDRLDVDGDDVRAAKEAAVHTVRDRIPETTTPVGRATLGCLRGRIVDGDDRLKWTLNEPNAPTEEWLVDLEKARRRYREATVFTEHLPAALAIVRET